MKIGILTYHRSQNFGALLQAMALRKVMTEMGHNVYFIDYWPDYHRNLYKLLDWNLLRLPYGLQSLYLFARSIGLYLPRKRRHDVFESFISRYIEPYVLPYTANEAYDAIVYGSDQIWRKQSGLGNRFNPVYFGDNILRAKRSISYAASMGVIHSSDNDKTFLRERLSAFSDVFVREKSLKNLLADCGIAAEMSLDPTLLLKQEDWMRLFGIKTRSIPDYLLFYDLQSSSIDHSIIKKYAEEKGLGIKVIQAEAHLKKENGIEYIDDADPAMFVNLFLNAKEVITSSYHGLVFSLLFNKNFLTVFSVNQDRAKSLLETLSLSDRMLSPRPTSIPDLSSIDYTEVNRKLDKEREESLTLLSKALNRSLNDNAGDVD